MDLTTDLGVLVRVLGAMGIGMLLGLERELSDKPAGLRTHMLLTGAACLLVLLGDLVITEFGAAEAAGIIRSDPVRIFEAIVVGVSFIGTGTIWKDRSEGRVEGLTTAASLLFAASLGIAVAIDRWALAVALAVAALGIGRALRWLEDRYMNR